MNLTTIRLSILGALLLFIGGWIVADSWAQDLKPIPQLSGRVVDVVSALDPSSKALIEDKLMHLDNSKGVQGAVLITDSVIPEDIAQYSLRVAEEWKIGRKRIDSGFLLVVATTDRRLRLEVGYGIEGAVSDIKSKQILDDIMAPRLRQKDLRGAIVEAIDAIERLVNGEDLLSKVGVEPDPIDQILPLVILGLILTSILSPFLGRSQGSLAASGLTFAAGLIIASMTISVIATFAVMVLGAFSGGSGYHFGGRGGRYGGFGGVGSSGGGFSGGGGRFGGGGASGSW